MITEIMKERRNVPELRVHKSKAECRRQDMYRDEYEDRPYRLKNMYEDIQTQIFNARKSIDERLDGNIVSIANTKMYSDDGQLKNTEVRSLCSTEFVDMLPLQKAGWEVLKEYICARLDITRDKDIELMNTILEACTSRTGGDSFQSGKFRFNEKISALDECLSACLDDSSRTIRNFTVWRAALTTDKDGTLCRVPEIYKDNESMIGDIICVSLCIKSDNAVHQYDKYAECVGIADVWDSENIHNMIADEAVGCGLGYSISRATFNDVIMSVTGRTVCGKSGIDVFSTMDDSGKDVCDAGYRFFNIAKDAGMVEVCRYLGAKGVAVISGDGGSIIWYPGSESHKKYEELQEKVKNMAGQNAYDEIDWADNIRYIFRPANMRRFAEQLQDLQKRYCDGRSLLSDGTDQGKISLVK